MQLECEFPDLRGTLHTQARNVINQLEMRTRTAFPEKERETLKKENKKKKTDNSATR